MSGFRSVMKDGWHPKGRDGGKESWRGDFKGINQVAGWMGKARDPNKKDGEEHVSRPLNTLKDPASFGPPPKNVNYHGGAALPNEITPQRGGWGAPLTQEQISSASQAVNTPEEEAEEEKKPAGPPLPYRADRTGLKTDHLPPPPVHRDLYRSSEAEETGPIKPKPGLPPRLPSRQNTGSTPPPPVAHSPVPTTAPPAYDPMPATATSSQPPANYGINQAAVNRLGNAGVSVPALGIGSDQNSNPWRNEPSQPSGPKSPPVTSQPPVNQLSELQARFARMGSSSSSGQQSNTTPPFVTPAQSPPPATANAPPIQQPYATQPQPQSQAQGTTWAEKQAAMRTAQNAYKDPASVSAADAGSAVRTANSFRERHQESISAAGAKANQWNKKYNVTGRLNSFLEKHSSAEDAQSPNGMNAGGNAPMQVSPQNQTAEMAASISRKPPPPPPPKKPANMHGSVAPPPVPLGTKPSYS